MVKYFLNFFLIFFMLSTIAFARITEVQLQQEFGSNLTQVPFYLRFSFSKEYHKDWDKSVYSERKNFLHDYKANVAAEQAKDKIIAKAEAAKEKADIREQRVEARKERDALKADADQARADQMAENARQKEFNTSLIDQSKELDQMQRESTRGTGLMSSEGSAASTSPTSDQAASDQGPSQGSY